MSQVLTGGFDTVVVLDFGSQYSQLIARRVREAGVYSILLPWDTDLGRGRTLSAEGHHPLRWTGKRLRSGSSLAARLGPPRGRPRAGNLLWHALDRKRSRRRRRVSRSSRIWPGHDRGDATIAALPKSARIAGCLDEPRRSRHAPPTGYVGIARSHNAPIAGMSDGRRFGIQFHPEVVHTPLGRDLLRNFFVDVCSAGRTGPRSISSTAPFGKSRRRSAMAGSCSVLAAVSIPRWRPPSSTARSETA